MKYGRWMTNAEKLWAALKLRAECFQAHSVRNWHYAVVTFEGPAIGLYIDEVPIATKLPTASPNSDGKENLRMGADSQCLNNYFVRLAS